LTRFIAVAVFGAATVLGANADDAPWEFGSVPTPVSQTARPGTLGSDVLGVLVNLYRDNKDDTSIHRCIFHVSCSHFAQRAVERYGVVLGGVAFIDRYFYRENNDARLFYPLERESDGTFRLNDGPFVP